MTLIIITPSLLAGEKHIGKPAPILKTIGITIKQFKYFKTFLGDKNLFYHFYVRKD
jgi:hypothetical protein